jgi:hypothetical protein
MAPAVEHREPVVASAAGTGAMRQSTAEAEASMTMTSTEEINNTITRPGSVKINVKGAFIVDPDTSTPAVGGTGNSQVNGRGSPTHHETSDIRLPNHTAVVSHIAVDVRHPPVSPSLRHSWASPTIEKRSALTRYLYPFLDWRVAYQTRLLFSRGPFHRTWWPTEFPDIRDRSDRRLCRVHEASA